MYIDCLKCLNGGNQEIERIKIISHKRWAFQISRGMNYLINIIGIKIMLDPYTLNKKSKWIKYLNIKGETMNMLEESIEEFIISEEGKTF